MLATDTTRPTGTRDIGPIHRALVLVLLATVPVLAATPPALVNYQGVLRDNNDKPLSGTYDMTFRFMDAPTAGNEILIDQHAAATANAVTVSGGLFNVALGSGTVTDGIDSGTYTSLDQVFRDYASVWLEVKIGTETLAPRTRFQAAAYALNATNSTQLGGNLPSFFLDTSSNYQLKPGPVRFSTSDTTATASVAAICDGTSMGYWSDGCVDYGGFFQATGPSSTGVVGNGFYYGVRGYGGTIGGFFADGPEQNQVFLGDSLFGYGVRSYGASAGGYFSGAGGQAYAVLGDAAVNTGVWGHGSYRGGYFETVYGAYAEVGRYDCAVCAHAVNGVGGNFTNDGAGQGSYVEVAQNQFGIVGKAYFGTRFETFSNGWANTAYSSYKVTGTGSVSFVQNHPADPSKVIVYAAPEGDEVAVYTRGSARLIDGEARVTLGPTFALVANPDIGLTATVTPLGDPIALSVVDKSTRELTVRGPAGSKAAFDYVVWGLRIGFEEQSIVQPKQWESKIPSMHQHEQFFADEPGLHEYTALARFEGIEQAVHGKPPHDFSRADTLRNAVGVFEYKNPPAATTPADAPMHPGGATAGPTSTPVAHLNGLAAISGGSPRTDSPVAPVAPPQETPVQFVAPIEMPVVEPVEAGDLLSLDPAEPGKLRRSSSPSDPGVVGIAAQASTSVGDAPKVALVVTNYALVKVDARFGAIHPGDLLVSSSTVGHAMVAQRLVPGTVIGKALEGLESGAGSIHILLMSR